MWRTDGSVVLLLFHLILAVSARSHMHARSVGEDPYAEDQPQRTNYDNVDWWTSGQDELKRTLNFERNVGKAKNIILFIGDGMGPTTVTAARVYNEQKNGVSGYDALLSWETFPHSGFSKTYTTDYFVPDSAGTATAFLCGVKARSGVIGVNSNVIRGHCKSSLDNPAKSILKYSIDEGKWTGVVSTARVTHATPASAYANSPERNWESDADVPEPDRYTCKDIASQFVDDDYNKQIRVMMGGGRFSFYPEGTEDPEGGDRANGTRLDGRNLPEEWLAQKVASGVSADRVAYVMNLTDFNNASPDNTDYLLGLFESSHMQYDLDREDPSYEEWGEPSLTEMTEKAIRILSRNEDGFFLLVEGGRIDHGHHANMAVKALGDTLALSDAIKKAAELTSTDDTLIVVSADHSHAFTINGYPKWSNDILGHVGQSANPDIPAMALDDKPWMALGYHNGPGFLVHRMENGTVIPRRNTTNDPTVGMMKNYTYDAGIYLDSETHGGSDVGVFSQGPWSHLMTGLHENQHIAHVMMYASCMGPGLTSCNQALSDTSSSIPVPSWALLLLLTMIAALNVRNIHI